MKRAKAIEAINELPSEFKLEELIERLLFIEKVEEGLEQLRQGKTTPHHELKKEIKQWSR